MTTMQPPKVRCRIEILCRETALKDLGDLGRRVGDRIGSNRRSHSQIEDYCVRQLVLGRLANPDLALPTTIEMLEPDPKGGWPDALLTWSDHAISGLEVTAAGSREYQEQLTREERIASKLPDDEIAVFDSSVDGYAGPATDAVARDIAIAIRQKAKARESGQKYAAVETCDLLVYEISDGGESLSSKNTEAVSEVIHKLHFERRLPASLANSFRHVHLLIRQFYVHSLFHSPTIYRFAADVEEVAS